VFRQAELSGDAGRGVEFPPMPLAVIKGEADHPLPVFQGEGRGGGGIQTA